MKVRELIAAVACNPFPTARTMHTRLSQSLTTFVGVRTRAASRHHMTIISDPSAQTRRRVCPLKHKARTFALCMVCIVGYAFVAMRTRRHRAKAYESLHLKSAHACNSMPTPTHMHVQLACAGASCLLRCIYFANTHNNARGSNEAFHSMVYYYVISIRAHAQRDRVYISHMYYLLVTIHIVASRCRRHV